MPTFGECATCGRSVAAFDDDGGLTTHHTYFPHAIVIDRAADTDHPAVLKIDEAA